MQAARNGGAVIKVLRTNGEVSEKFVMLPKDQRRGVEISQMISSFIAGVKWVPVFGVQNIPIDSKLYIDGLSVPLLVIAIDYDDSRVLCVAEK